MVNDTGEFPAGSKGGAAGLTWWRLIDYSTT